MASPLKTGRILGLSPKPGRTAQEDPLLEAVCRMMVFLRTLVASLPIGTNLGLLHLLWMLASGRLLAARGALFPELALLAGSVRAYAAATVPAIPTGFGDRCPRSTPGRLRRPLALSPFPQGFPPNAPPRISHPHRASPHRLLVPARPPRRCGPGRLPRRSGPSYRKLECRSGPMRRDTRPDRCSTPSRRRVARPNAYRFLHHAHVSTTLLGREYPDVARTAVPAPINRPRRGALHPALPGVAARRIP